MFRSAMLAVLAVALSSSPAVAQGGDEVIRDEAVDQQATAAAAGSSSLMISAEAVLSVTSPASLVPFVAPVDAESSALARRGAPWWPTALAIAGPLADGFSTMYAMRQSGPNARVAEGNGLFHKLFGSDVTAGEILAFKVAQAALVGYGVRVTSKSSLEKAVGSALLQSAVNFWVTSQNMRNAARAKRLNAGTR